MSFKHSVDLTRIVYIICHSTLVAFYLVSNKCNFKYLICRYWRWSYNSSKGLVRNWSMTTVLQSHSLWCRRDIMPDSFPSTMKIRYIQCQCSLIKLVQNVQNCILKQSLWQPFWPISLLYEYVLTLKNISATCMPQRCPLHLHVHVSNIEWAYLDIRNVCLQTQHCAYVYIYTYDMTVQM